MDKTLILITFAVLWILDYEFQFNHVIQKRVVNPKLFFTRHTIMVINFSNIFSNVGFTTQFCSIYI